MEGANGGVFRGVMSAIVLLAIFAGSGLILLQHIAARNIASIPVADLSVRGEALLANRFATPVARIALAERLMVAGAEHDVLSRRLLLSATAGAGDQPFAWAQLAFLETRQAGRFNAAAQDALARSIAECPLCDEALLKWRLTFILANWDDAPDDMRRQVFEGADLLAWWYHEVAFLAEMEEAAKAGGIPYEDYRQRVGLAAGRGG